MSYIIWNDAKPVMKNNVMIAFKTLRSQILFISMGEYLLNTPNVPFMY